MQDRVYAARWRYLAEGQFDKVTSLRHRRMFRGNKKEKRKGAVGNWPYLPNTPLQRAHGLLPLSIMPLAKTHQDAAKNVTVFEKLIRGFSLPVFVVSKMDQSKKKRCSQKVVKKKILRIELSVGLLALYIAKSCSINLSQGQSVRHKNLRFTLRWILQHVFFITVYQ